MRIVDNLQVHEILFYEEILLALILDTTTSENAAGLLFSIIG